MKKFKFLSLVLSIILIASVFSACGATKSTDQPNDSVTKTPEPVKTQEPAKKIHLKMWGGVPAENGPQAVCDEFNKLNADKGISIEYERFVNDEPGNLKLETNLLAGSDIDLYMTYAADKMKKRATGNLALDLSDYIKKDNYDVIAQYGMLAEDWSVDGKYFGIPTNKSPAGLIVNKKMFDDAGIPVPTAWTYDEFREIAKKLTKGEGQDKIYGMYFNTQQFIDYGLAWTATTLGGDWQYKDGGKEANYNLPEAQKVYQLLYDMMNVDKSAPTHVDSVTQKLTIEGLFLSGKAAISHGVYTMRSIRDLNNFPHDFVTAFVPYPVIDKSTPVFSATGLGDVLSINPKSQNIDAAWEFLKWYGGEGMAPMVPGGRIPLNSSFDADAIVKSAMAGVENLFDAQSYKNVMIKAPEKYVRNKILIPEAKKIQDEESEAIYLGKKTPAQGLEDMSKRVTEILKK